MTPLDSGIATAIVDATIGYTQTILQSHDNA